jgi:BMFP domain-containing protein YqiC
VWRLVGQSCCNLQPALKAGFSDSQQREFPSMSDRPRFFNDLAGVAGGAISALSGLRDEAEAVMRARLDDLIQRLDLVRREELEAIQELAANARSGQEAAEARAASLEHRLTALEARVAALEAPRDDVVAPEGF